MGGRSSNKPYPFLTPPENSIEKELVDLKYRNAFLEFKNFDAKEYYCSALGNLL